MRLPNRKGNSVIYTIIFILLILGAAYWVYWYYIGIWQGVHYTAEATVVRVEESDKFYPHTYVDVKINEYTSDTYLFYGVDHNLIINHRYHIEWTSGTIWRWDRLSWDVVGWVTKIEEVTA